METIRVLVITISYATFGSGSLAKGACDPSVDRLLHRASVCVAESAILQNEGGESYRSDRRSASALDVVRQLATVYEKKMFEWSMRSDAEIVIEGMGVDSYRSVIRSSVDDSAVGLGQTGVPDDNRRNVWPTVLAIY